MTYVAIANEIVVFLCRETNGERFAVVGLAILRRTDRSAAKDLIVTLSKMDLSCHVFAAICYPVNGTDVCGIPIETEIVDSEVICS